jgi:hypothetical protein
MYEEGIYCDRILSFYEFKKDKIRICDFIRDILQFSILDNFIIKNELSKYFSYDIINSHLCFEIDYSNYTVEFKSEPHEFLYKEIDFKVYKRKKKLNKLF